MAQTGYTPIQLYYSTTAAAQPTAGNLLDGELALNITDGKLYYKDGSTIKLLASNASSSSDVTGPASSTANGIVLFNGTTGKILKDSASTDGLINGLTVGKGAGAVSSNTAVGASAMASNTTGDNGTFVGSQAGYNNTTGVGNSYIGSLAGQYQTTGSRSTAVGYTALRGSSTTANNTGNYNTAVGIAVLASNTSGSDNVGVGGGNGASYYTTLSLNTTGSYNTAFGNGALAQNTTASYNTAVGYQAGYSNSTGTVNTLIGKSAGYALTGTQNTFIGGNAGLNATTGSNTFIGSGSGTGVTTGTKNTFIGGGDSVSVFPSGYYVTTGNSNTIIGNYNGNQGGLDIRTASNYIVLSDGDGNPRGYWDNNGTFTLTVDYKEQVYTANSSTAITLSLANGSVQIITLTGSATITMPTAVAGKSFTLLLKTGAGSYGVVWSTVNWPSGTAPTITTAASKMDKFVFTSDGTNWYGSVAGQAYAV